MCRRKENCEVRKSREEKGLVGRIFGGGTRSLGGGHRARRSKGGGKEHIGETLGAAR